MKTIDEILKTPRLYGFRTGEDGGRCIANLLSSKRTSECSIVFSWGGGWDHVSASFPSRTPTWEEMAEIKRMFFHPDECCVEYHPVESEYVNMHPHCLHIWKPQTETIPTPPYWMVGIKKGQSYAEMMNEAKRELGETL